VVVGFGVSYACVGGSRVVGAVNGLQLLYILPSFPPYQPDSLDSRLVGLTGGIGLLILADRLLWPEPGPEPFTRRLGDAARGVRAYLLHTLERPVGAAADSVGNAVIGAAAGNGQLRTATSAPLRLSHVPALERPTGPGARDRAAAHATVLLRGLDSRAASLRTLLNEDGHGLGDPEQRLVHAAADTLGAVADALAGDGPVADPRVMEADLGSYLAERADRVSHLPVGDAFAERVRGSVLAEEIAIWTRDLAVSTKVIIDGPLERTRPRPAADPLWWSTSPTRTLWTRRIAGHLTPRSVFFQNAVRLALGLGLARVVAGELDTSHGFWVLLATLTLMRTSVLTTGAAVWPALVGTALGVAAAGVVLTTVAEDSVVLELALPPVMVLALVAGRWWGPLAAQALFTLVVTLIFAQLAPVTWQLAGIRVADVVVGAALGLLVGLLVWPRGAAAEMRRTGAATLVAAAYDMESTVRSMVEGPHRSADSTAAHLMHLADSTYAQYRSEPGRAKSQGPDWMGLLGLAREVVWGGEALRRSHEHAGGLPWPAVASDLEVLGRQTADGLRGIARRVGSDGRRHRRTASPRMPSLNDWLDTERAKTVGRDPSDPAASIRVFDLWGWLAGVSLDAYGIDTRTRSPSGPNGHR